MKRLLCLLLLCSSFTMLRAQDFSLYEKKVLINGKDTLRYRILYPENYKKRRAYPLVVFLHGSGERGRDNEAQLTHGGKLFIRPEVRKHFQSIVIFPQCPADSVWSRFRRLSNADEWAFVTDGEPPVPQRL